VAVAAAAALYVVGALLIATSVVLPHVTSEAGATTVGIVALFTAAAQIAELARGGGTVMLAFLADLWGVVLIGVLVWSTGGSGSPFALIYFFAIGHAAAFQPRERFIAVTAACLAAFLAPLAYSDVSTRFVAFAVVGGVLALLTGGAIHAALGRMREQRTRLRFVIEATSKLDTSLDPQRALRRIAQMPLPQLAELCVIDLLDQAGAVATTVADATDQALAARVEQMHAVDPPDLHPANPVSVALATRNPYVLDERDEPADIGLDGHRRMRRERGLFATAVMPLVARGRLLGTIAFFRSRRFERGELAVLEDLAGRAGLAYDNARLYDERARVARTLRRSLMPSALPAIPGLELESYFRPMGAGSEVGGDFYDVFGDRGSFWLVVGDVCGKGTEAAVLTGFLRHTAVAYAREGAGPASVLARVNHAMLKQDFEGRFATAILARLELRESGVQATLATAGHPSALITRAAGEVEELGEYGTLLGVFPDPSIVESTTLLQGGDSLLLYTDGLTEAHAPDRVLAVEDLKSQLAQERPHSARAAIDALLALLDDAPEGRDDIALLAACVLTNDRSGQTDP
jgi:Stage II sporulation protein E (SpoIIE)/GAF domain